MTTMTIRRLRVRTGLFVAAAGLGRPAQLGAPGRVAVWLAPAVLRLVGVVRVVPVVPPAASVRLVPNVVRTDPDCRCSPVLERRAAAPGGNPERALAPRPDGVNSLTPVG
jgi:hypothetical protein